MNLFFGPIAELAALGGLQDMVAHLADVVLAADTATFLDWMAYGVVILGVTFLGVLPLLSLLTATLTLACLPLLLRGRTPNHLRRLFGISDPRVPQARPALEAHLSAMHSDLPRTLVRLLVIGLFPLLGVAVGLIHYRLSRVAALRSEIVTADLGLLRWLLPVSAAGLIAIQPLPVIGPLSLPLLYATYHAVYDTMLKRRQPEEDMLPIAALAR